ncbi:gliding motility lipoprotein GldD [Sphingobacteriaceae bacterium]|nr:gliding motility lipoprotein GldD [Sphingobacteriaceae bacterium]
MNFKVLIFCVLVSITLISCDEEEEVYAPRPRGYCRIDFPEKSYRVYDSICPYKFEIPLYSHFVQDKHKGAEPCWLNLEFPKFKATIHLSYKAVNNDLANHLENSHYFANKHQVKATGLDEVVILRDSAKVYGLLFDIAGNTASPLQFYLTDSTKHFLRGALYFNSVPNIDSLKIVVDFIRADVLHMINSTSWKKDDAVTQKK